MSALDRIAWLRMSVGFHQSHLSRSSYATDMNSIISDFEAANTPLARLLDTVQASQWNKTSPCAGWTVRDVVGHLIDTQRQFLVVNGVGLGDAPELGTDPAAAWRSHSTSVLEALADDDVAGREFDGAFGRSTIGDTLVQFYVWDMVAHRWDIAHGAGFTAELSATELDRLERGIESFGDALYMDGICKPGVTAPANASRATLVLASLGRQL